jgi:hypothetical protein
MLSPFCKFAPSLKSGLDAWRLPAGQSGHIPCHANTTPSAASLRTSCRAPRPNLSGRYRVRREFSRWLAPSSTSTFWWCLTVVAAVAAAVSDVLNPFAEHYNHLNAAKGFTILKQDARSLRDTFSAAMSDDTFGAAVHSLHDRYNDLVASAPTTGRPHPHGPGPSELRGVNVHRGEDTCHA